MCRCDPNKLTPPAPPEGSFRPILTPAPPPDIDVRVNLNAEGLAILRLTPNCGGPDCYPPFEWTQTAPDIHERIKAVRDKHDHQCGLCGGGPAVYYIHVRQEHFGVCLGCYQPFQDALYHFLQALKAGVSHHGRKEQAQV